MLRRLLFFSLISFFFFNCASVPAFSTKSDCRHRALVSAFTFADKGYPVRIAYGKRDNLAHVQAQAYIDNKWQFLSWDGERVWVGKKKIILPSHTHLAWESLSVGNFFSHWSNGRKKRTKRCMIRKSGLKKVLAWKKDNRKEKFANTNIEEPMFKILIMRRIRVWEFLAPLLYYSSCKMWLDLSFHSNKNPHPKSHINFTNLLLSMISEKTCDRCFWLGWGIALRKMVS